VPTIDSATWWPTPASRSAASCVLVERVKKSRTGPSSNDGELATSTTHLRAGQRLGDAGPAQRVDPGRRRGGHRHVAALAQRLDQRLPDQTGTPDDDDPHGVLLLVNSDIYCPR
jgi:hypothetical protein